MSQEDIQLIDLKDAVLNAFRYLDKEGEEAVGVGNGIADQKQ